MRIIGIDPGINGAVALFRVGDRLPVLPEGVVDLPTVGEGTQRELNYVALRDELWRLRADMVVIERLNAMPGVDEDGERTVKMGATSLFRMGGGFYSIIAVASCLNLDVRRVNAGQWKRHFALKGGKASKEASRLLAIQRFPAAEVALRRKMDHQRAEAMLIAAFAAYKFGGARDAGVAPRAVELPIRRPGGAGGRSAGAADIDDEVFRDDDGADRHPDVGEPPA